MASPPPPSPYEHSDLSPFCYGLAVIGTAALLLAVYNLIIVGCCRRHRLRQSQQRSNESIVDTSLSFETSMIKYQKRDTLEQASDNECAVCLSVFEDGEALRQLPQCKHSFHASCIDMWLYSHSNCPLCRATVALAALDQLVRPEDSQQQGLPSSHSPV